MARFWKSSSLHPSSLRARRLPHGTQEPSSAEAHRLLPTDETPGGVGRGRRRVAYPRGYAVGTAEQGSARLTPTHRVLNPAVSRLIRATPARPPGRRQDCSRRCAPTAPTNCVNVNPDIPALSSTTRACSRTPQALARIHSRSLLLPPSNRRPLGPEVRESSSPIHRERARTPQGSRPFLAKSVSDS